MDLWYSKCIRTVHAVNINVLFGSWDSNAVHGNGNEIQYKNVLKPHFLHINGVEIPWSKRPLTSAAYYNHQNSYESPATMYHPYVVVHLFCSDLCKSEASNLKSTAHVLRVYMYSWLFHISKRMLTSNLSQLRSFNIRTLEETMDLNFKFHNKVIS